MSQRTHNIFKSTDYQDLFNLAYRGILGQGQPSVTKDRDVCLYSDHRGNHCGVGHTLTNEALDIVTEDEYDVDGLIEKLNQAGFIWDYDNDDNITLTQFLQELQSAHDQASQGLNESEHDSFLRLFSANMDQIAKEHSLTVPHV